MLFTAWLGIGTQTTPSELSLSISEFIFWGGGELSSFPGSLFYSRGSYPPVASHLYSTVLALPKEVKLFTGSKKILRKYFHWPTLDCGSMNQ